MPFGTGDPGDGAKQSAEDGDDDTAAQAEYRGTYSECQTVLSELRDWVWRQFCFPQAAP